MLKLLDKVRPIDPKSINYGKTGIVVRVYPTTSMPYFVEYEDGELGHGSERDYELVNANSDRLKEIASELIKIGDKIKK